MGQFGQDLRKEREYRGISLFRITETTKISARHLEALEEERFEDLPGGVFNKGIVRGYARVVGLDEEEWVERYMAAFAQAGLLRQDEADWVRFAENVGQTRPRESERPDMRLRWAGVAVLLLLLAGLGWFVWQYVHEKVSAGNRTTSAPGIVLSRGSVSHSLSYSLTHSGSHSLQWAPTGPVNSPLG
jgi:cytoskeleton protein RodZ